MPRAGLNRQAVIQGAVRLMEEKGFRAFGMRELAKSLEVQPASLYNHVASMDEVMGQVGSYAVSLLNQEEFEAIQGRNGREAVIALAMAYRHFARAHPELYKVIMSLHRTDKAVIEQAAHPITEPFLQVLESYPLTEEGKMHWQRVLRSMLHGFVSQEEAGYFCHFPIDTEESYRLAVQCCADGLEAATSRQEEPRE